MTEATKARLEQIIVLSRRLDIGVCGRIRELAERALADELATDLDRPHQPLNEAQRDEIARITEAARYARVHARVSISTSGPHPPDSDAYRATSGYQEALHRPPYQPAPTRNEIGDMVCEHGTAMDVHCCNCHSGFLFDITQCVCDNQPDMTLAREVIETGGFQPDTMIMPDDVIQELGGDPAAHPEVAPGVRVVRACPECDGKGMVLDAPADVLDGHPYQTECPECHGTGRKP
jgi:hypothetical protein